MAGIEPASIGDDSRLLRAQPLLRVLDLLVSCGPASNKGGGGGHDLFEGLRQEEKALNEDGESTARQEDRRGRHGKEAWASKHVSVLRRDTHDLQVSRPI